MAVCWIDWYAYHVGRFRGLAAHSSLAGKVAGIEVVGGTGVHTGLKFREPLPDSLPVTTLLPDSNWHDVSFWKLASLTWSALNRLNPSTVLVPGYYNAPGLAAALWGKLKRRRTVLMTESTEADHARHRVKEAFKGLLIRCLFDWAIAGGKPHRRYLEKLGFRPDRIGQFYDVVDNDLFRQGTDALRVRHRAADFGLPERYFLYVGRLAEEKNVGTLLSAYLEYRRTGGSWPLVVVGDGPLRAALEEASARSGFADTIHFAGLKGSRDLPAYYAFAGCFVLPSSREPWGLVVNEAMASGLPVIVSSACGCAEDLVAPSLNGFVFDPVDGKALTTSLSMVAERRPDELAAMGRHSSEVISRFSPAAWASEVARIANL